MTRRPLKFQVSSFCFAVLFVGAGCGVSDKAQQTGSPKLSFANDIDPIIKASCSDAGCHGKAGAASVVYEGNETLYKASQTAAIPTSKRLALADTDANKMPRGKTLTDADKQKLLAFLTQ